MWLIAFVVNSIFAFESFSGFLSICLFIVSYGFYDYRYKNKGAYTIRHCYDGAMNLFNGPNAS